MGRKQKKNSYESMKVTGNVLSRLSGDQKIEILNKYLTEPIIRVFEDKELVKSVDVFFDNNLNVSETSRNAFIHRNTLLYRIAKINRITKYNIRNFDDAVSFRLLELIYKEAYKQND